MKRFKISPGGRLYGEVYAAGSKNSALPILAAAALSEKSSEIYNCPDISDIRNTVEILKYLGCGAEFEDGTVTVDPHGMDKYDIPYVMMEEMRSSIIFLGTLLARFGRAEISMPGGCDLGPRPIDIHVGALKKMGAEFLEYNGFLYAEAQELRGANIQLPIASVGATENIMLAAATARGRTAIYNAAREPEIVDLAEMLTGMGAKIMGAGSGIMEIDGVKELQGASHTVIPDRIEAATIISAALITGGTVTVKGVIGEHLQSVTDIFEKAGAEITVKKTLMTVKSPPKLLPVSRIITAPYPGFPTDCQPVITAMLSVADGVSLMSERVFDSRFKYINELYRMGADIYVDDKTAVILGNSKLTGARTSAPDLRGGAALVIAALASSGKSEIENIHHIERGYEALDKKLSELGADITVSN